MDTFVKRLLFCEPNLGYIAGIISLFLFLVPLFLSFFLFSPQTTNTFHFLFLLSRLFSFFFLTLSPLPFLRTFYVYSRRTIFWLF